MLIEDDYETWVMIMQSVADQPSEMMQLYDDLKTCTEAVINSGSLPGNAADKTDAFLGVVKIDIVKKLLSLRGLSRGDGEAAFQILLTMAEFGVKGFVAQKPAIAENACLILGDETRTLYTSNKAARIRERIIEQLQEKGELETMKAAAFSDDTVEANLVVYAAVILKKCSETGDWFQIFQQTAELLKRTIRLNARGFDCRLLRSCFTEFTTELKKEEKFDYVMCWMDVFVEMLRTEILEKQLEAVRLIADLMSEEQNESQLEEWFKANGTEAITTLEIRSEFSGHIGRIYEFLASKGLVTFDAIQQLWQTQQFLHVSLVSAFFDIFGKISKKLPLEIMDKYVDMIMSPPSECPDWVNCICETALSTKDRAELAVPFQKLRDIVFKHAFDDSDTKSQQTARRCLPEIIGSGISDGEARRLVNELLDRQTTDFTLRLIQEISNVAKFLDDSISQRLSEMVAANITTSKTIGALLSSLVKNQQYEMDKDLVDAIFSNQESTDVVTELIKGDVLKDSLIEERLLSCEKVDKFHLVIAEAYVSKQNDLTNGLKSLPIKGEHVLWRLAGMLSDIHKDVCECLVNVYTENDQQVITSQEMIEFFLNIWEQQYKERSNSREQLLSLLSTFVASIEDRMDTLEYAIVRHSGPAEARVEEYNIVGEPLEKGLTMKVRAGTKAIVLMTKVARETALDLDSFRLYRHPMTFEPDEVIGHDEMCFSDDLMSIQMIPEENRKHVKRSQTVPPSWIIVNSPLMDVLMESLNSGGKEAARLMSRLPTHPAIVNQIKGLKKKNHADFTSLLPAESHGVFNYVLSVLCRTDEDVKVARDLDLISYLASVLRKACHSSMIMAILDCIADLLTEETNEKYAPIIFDPLVRLSMANANSETSDIARKSLEVLGKVAKFVSLKPVTESSLQEFFERKEVEEKKEDKKEDSRRENQSERRHITMFTDGDDSPQSFSGDDMHAEFERIFARLHGRMGRTRRNASERAPGREFREIEDKEVVSVETFFADTKIDCQENLVFNLMSYVLLTNASDLGGKCADIIEKVGVPVGFFVKLLPQMTDTTASRVYRSLAPHLESCNEDLMSFLVANLKEDSDVLSFVLPTFRTLIEKKLIDESSLNRVCDFLVETFVSFERPRPEKNVSMTDVFGVLSFAPQEKIVSIANYLNEHQPPFGRYSVSADSVSKTGISGLVNLGATCFLNATLQQFFHIPALRKLVISYTGEDEFLQELAKLFAKMRECKGVVQTTSDLVAKWINWDGQKLNPREQQDASEFTQMLIDKLLALGPGTINEMFQGKMKMKVEGIDEPFSHEFDEPFTSLMVEIKGCQMLSESLDLMHSPDFFTGNNQYFAESLRRRINARRTASVASLPNHVIIQLKRFSFDVEARTRSKIDDVLDFPLNVDFTEHCATKDVDGQYHLSGIVVHAGSAMFGHYYSYVLKDGKWYCCNDRSVEEVEIDDMCKKASGRDSRSTSAFLLFYTRNSVEEVDDFAVSPALSEAIEMERATAERSYIFCDSGLTLFYQRVSKDGSQQIKELAFTYALTTLAHTTFQEKVISILENLAGMGRVAEIVASVDLTPCLLKCPSTDYRKKVATFLFSSLEHSQVVFDKLVGMLPEATAQFVNSSSYWAVLSSFEKEQLQTIVEPLKRYITEVLAAWLKEDKDRTKRNCSSNESGLEWATDCLLKAEEKGDFWLDEDLFSTCIETSIRYDQMLTIYRDRKEFVSDYFLKKSLTVDFGFGLASLLNILKSDTFDLLPKLKFRSGKRLADDGDFAAEYVDAAHRNRVIELDTYLDKWLKPMILSRNERARKKIMEAVGVLVPHKVFQIFDRDSFFSPRSVERVEKLDEKGTEMASKILTALLEYLADAMTIIERNMPEMPEQELVPLDNFTACELLELISLCMKAMEYKGTLEPIHNFLRNLLPFTQAYDPHLRRTLAILVDYDCPDDLLCQCLKPLNEKMGDFYTRADVVLENLLPLLKKVSVIPEETVITFLTSFAFMKPVNTAKSLNKIQDFTEFLIERCRETVIQILDRDLEANMQNNLPMVVFVLDKCHEKRHVIDKLTGWKDFKQMNENDFIQLGISVNTGSLGDAISFVEMIERKGLTRATRDAIWQVIDTEAVSVGEITKLSMNVGCVARKARFILAHASEVESPVDYLLMCCVNSFKALGVCSDFLVENAEDPFLSLDYASVVLKRWWEPKAPASKRTDHPNWRQNRHHVRKLDNDGIRKYLTVVIPKIGKEKAAELLSWYTRDVIMSVKYVNDVIIDAKDESLAEEDIGQMTEGITTLSDLAPFVELSVVETLQKNSTLKDAKPIPSKLQKLFELAGKKEIPRPVP